MKEDFYYQINQSHNNVNNQKYIELTTDIMNSYFKKQYNMDKLLVIGAGNLNDFNLEYFLSMFKKVYLTDIDLISMKQALKAKVNHSQIIIKQIDYIGTRENKFFDNFHELLHCSEYKQVQKFFQKKLNQLKLYKFSKYFDIKFDTIYISPIYTQLLYREIEAHLEALIKLGFSKEYKKNILLEILQDLVPMIDHFNNEICSLLKDKGTLFVATDIFYLTNDAFSNIVKENIYDQEKMNEIYQEYLKKYGYGIGDYGLYSLSRELNLIQEKWFLWGKQGNNSYAVKFCVMNK